LLAVSTTRQYTICGKDTVVAEEKLVADQLFVNEFQEEMKMPPPNPPEFALKPKAITGLLAAVPLVRNSNGASPPAGQFKDKPTVNVKVAAIFALYRPPI
jgi:hypothetical protein